MYDNQAMVQQVNVYIHVWIHISLYIYICIHIYIYIYESCCIRASLKTIKGFEGVHSELLALAVEEQPSSHHNYRAAIPMGWDSSAFCMNSSIAFKHLVISTILAEATPKGKSLQAIVFKHLCCSEEHSQLAWLFLLQCRAKLFQDWSKNFCCSFSSSSSSSSSEPQNGVCLEGAGTNFVPETDSKPSTHKLFESCLLRRFQKVCGGVPRRSKFGGPGGK